MYSSHTSEYLKVILLPPAGRAGAEWGDDNEALGVYTHCLPKTV